MKSHRTTSASMSTATADWVARNLSTAPPLAEVQLIRLAKLLNPVGLRQVAQAAAAAA